MVWGGGLFAAGCAGVVGLCVYRHEPTNRAIRANNWYWWLSIKAADMLRGVGDAETAHKMGLAALALRLGPVAEIPDDRLETEVCGMRFASPLGLAAGFDKRGEAVDAMGDLGFGFVEVGGVTLEPQTGNERPRVFRVSGRAIVNRVGLPSEGVEVVAKRLKARKEAMMRRLAYAKYAPRANENTLERVRKEHCLVGVNVARQKSDQDFADVAKIVAPYCDFVVVNASCPNVAGGVVDVKDLEALLTSAKEATDKPLFAKVSPDLGPKSRKAVAKAILNSKVDGIIVANTTKRRPGRELSDEERSDPPPQLLSPPPSRLRDGGDGGGELPEYPSPGGLSGPPLTASTRILVSDFYKLTNKLPIVGVGGVSSPEDAYALIRAGASLVQLYTALVYSGPVLPSHINATLLELAKRDGFETVQEAVGADHRRR